MNQIVAFRRTATGIWAYEFFVTLKQFQTRSGLTQKELAQMIGVTPQTLSKYEKGEWALNQIVIDRIRELYGAEIRPLKNRQRTWQKR